MRNEPSIFVSYASSQRLWANWLHNELLALNLRVELDSEDWRIGDGVVNKINDALVKHKIFLALWSPDYFTRDRWTIDEINAAYGLYRQGVLSIIPFYVEPVDTVPPLYKNLISSVLYDLTEKATRYELRLRLEPIIGRPLRTYPSPSKIVTFPGKTLVSHTAFAKLELASKADLLRIADEQSKKVLTPSSNEDVNLYALEDIAYQLRLLSRSYNSEPPQYVLKQVLTLWSDLDLAEKLAQNNPSRFIDVLVLKSRAYGLQSYAALDLGDPKSAFRHAIAMKLTAQKANHSELVAWALGTQTLIYSFDDEYKRALPLIEEGLRLPISGMARSRLHSRAVMCWSEFGHLENTIKSIRASEKIVDEEPWSRDEADGIFFFSRAKHHYYAGTGLMAFSVEQARQAEKETSKAIELFKTGDDDTKSISDELLASIYLATSISKQDRIDEVLDTLSPILTIDPEYRTSWHLLELRALWKSLKLTKRFRDSVITERILEAINEFEKDINV